MAPSETVPGNSILVLSPGPWPVQTYARHLVPDPRLGSRSLDPLHVLAPCPWNGPQSLVSPPSPGILLAPQGYLPWGMRWYSRGGARRPNSTNWGSALRPKLGARIWIQIWDQTKTEGFASRMQGPPVTIFTSRLFWGCPMSPVPTLHRPILGSNWGTSIWCLWGWLVLEPPSPPSAIPKVST